ncbi:MAG: GntR family transcriptional regulator [Desulfobacteraceae bacterium]|nr:GntR family transcriptional regulator [Desulfobacteraceae bacterium]
MGLNKNTKPEPLSRTAYRILRNSILDNDLIVGVVYNEKGLAKDPGISRTPVKEAFLELASKRLVKFLPQKGVIINTFSNTDIEDVFEIRTTLEIFSIKKVCLNHGKTDISVFKEYLYEQKYAAKLQDTDRFMKADRKFHIGFTRLAENNYLMDMMSDIMDIMHLMGIKALNIKRRMEQVVKEHYSKVSQAKRWNKW